MRQRKSLALALSLALTIALAGPASAYDAARADTAQTLSGGAAESFAVDGGGALWAWGDNDFGQLGDGSAADRSLPVRVLEGVRSVSSAEGHTFAVLEDDTLWAWGRNINNAFPDSPLKSSARPVQIMEDVVSASTGGCTHLAIRTDGSLWAWGRYAGNRSNRQEPVPVKILDNVTAACTGFAHSLALKADGSLWTWGQNYDGGVGDGSTRVRLTPVKVMSGVVQMTAGYGFSAAVKKDGTLWTWGRNWQGELGNGTTASSSTPTKIMDRVVSVHASNNNAYALREDSSLWAWGNNLSGQVGDGTTTDRLSPVKVLDDVAEVSAGWDHVLAKKTDGTLWTWGANLCGQLGNGESDFYGDFVIRFSPFPARIMEGLDDGSPSPALAPGGTPASWAKPSVDEAAALDFLPLFLRTQYDQTITRAEFCALAVQFFETYTGQEAEARVTFPDTDDPNVEKAAGLGVVSGVDGGLFSPDAPLNREQAAVMLTNLARAAGFPLPLASASYDDLDAVSAWAQTAVGQVQRAGVMSTTGGGMFSPQSTYTREQSIVTIMNLYHFLAEDTEESG